MQRLRDWIPRPPPVWGVLVYVFLILLALDLLTAPPRPQPYIQPLPATAVYWMETNPAVVCEIPSWVCTDHGPRKQEMYPGPPPVSPDDLYDMELDLMRGDDFPWCTEQCRAMRNAKRADLGLDNRRGQ